MKDDVPRDLAVKIDRLLELVHAGKLTPDPIELLQAAVTLRACGEHIRAQRCVAIAARLMPNLHRDPVNQS